MKRPDINNLKDGSLWKGGIMASHICITLGYIGELYYLRPAELRAILSAEQFFQLWILAVSFYLYIMHHIFSDWLILNGHFTLWRKLHSRADDELLCKMKQRILCEGEEESIEQRPASTILVVLMVALTVAHVGLFL